LNFNDYKNILSNEQAQNYAEKKPGFFLINIPNIKQNHDELIVFHQSKQSASALIAKVTEIFK